MFTINDGVRKREGTVSCIQREQEEYENWRMQVEDWLELEEDNLKYIGLEIRLCLKGRALRLSEKIKREDLKR